MSNSPHPRYRSYSIVSPCRNSGCPHNGPDLKIILYIKDKKLRSHAIKHFTDTNEFPAWNKLSNISRQNARQIVTYCNYIKTIGCPYLRTSYDKSDPPCERCTLYKQCSKYANFIEDKYIKIIEAAITQGIAIPRYACYILANNLQYFVVIPDTNVAVKACYDNTRQAYNLTTCYCNPYKQWPDFLNSQEKNIKKQADRTKTVIWCTTEKWQIGAGVPATRPRYKPGSGKRRKFLKNWK